MKKILQHIVVYTFSVLFIVSTIGIKAVWHNCTMAGTWDLQWEASNCCCDITSSASDTNDDHSSITKDKCCININVYYKISGDYRTSEFHNISLNTFTFSEFSNPLVNVSFSEIGTIHFADSSPPPIIHKNNIIYSIHQLKICDYSSILS